MLVSINWTPTKRDLRLFGLTMLIAAAVIGALLYWREQERAGVILWSAGGIIFFLSWALPALAKPIYLVWMGIAFVTGTVISALILLIIFFAIFTPLALLMRLLRRDSLGLRKGSYPAGSYWIEHPDISDKTYYERLF